MSKEKHFVDVSELPPYHYAALNVVLQTFRRHGMYLQFGTEAIPGEQWKTDNEGLPVELGALSALIDKLFNYQALYFRDGANATKLLRRCATVVLEQMKRRIGAVEDPIARFALEEAIPDLEGFLNASDSPPAQREIAIGKLFEGPSSWQLRHDPSRN